jgi:hypothetical protein
MENFSTKIPKNKNSYPRKLCIKGILCMIRSDRMKFHRDIINKYLRCPSLKRFCVNDVMIKKTIKILP